MKILMTSILAGAALAASSFAAAEAMPIQTGLGQSASTILVSGGCGPYRHRTPWGGCRPNGWGGPGWRGPGWRGPGWHRGWRGPGWHRGWRG